MRQTIYTPSLKNIRITDDLFGRYAKMVAEKLLPYQWEVLNDRVEGAEKSWCIQNFRIAAGEAEGHHNGFVFGDTDVYKWLETLAFCMEAGYAGEFEAIADEAIELIGRAQQSDGYLNTYYTIDFPDRKWTNFTEGHELYTAGHLFEAAVAYYNATGKRKLLEIACRLADLICSLFGEGGQLEKACPGHPEVELALMKLFDMTGERKYADTALHFVSVRGTDPGFLSDNLASQGQYRIFPDFDAFTPEYAQAHMRPVEQTTAEGHSVRAMYLFSAMADLAREYKDESLEKACVTLWKNVTEKRMYITGGIGASGTLERFTADYDLPNDRMYCESCASVGLMMFGKRMAMLTGDASYYDTVERALCNTVLGGISAEGDRYFYVNPLEVWPENCMPSTSMAHVKPVRQPWFACACCPPNIARTLASVGQYIYAQDAKSIYVNQFISSELTTDVKDAAVKLTVCSALYTEGKVKVIIETEKAQNFTVRLRIPPYMRSVGFTFAGRKITPVIENGYAVIAVSHEGAQTLEISASVGPQFVAANTSVRADTGKLAMVYGPYVYCLEEEDNAPNLSALYVSRNSEIRCAAHCEALPGDLPMLRVEGKRLESFQGDELYAEPDFTFKDVSLSAVPYGLWCNRNPGEMTVWLKALF